MLLKTLSKWQHDLKGNFSCQIHRPKNFPFNDNFRFAKCVWFSSWAFIENFSNSSSSAKKKWLWGVWGIMSMENKHRTSAKRGRKLFIVNLINLYGNLSENSLPNLFDLKITRTGCPQRLPSILVSKTRILRMKSKRYKSFN